MTDVFVVETGCVVDDLDELDRHARHFGLYDSSNRIREGYINILYVELEKSGCGFQNINADALTHLDIYIIIDYLLLILY